MALGNCGRNMNAERHCVDKRTVSALSLWFDLASCCSVHNITTGHVGLNTA